MEARKLIQHGLSSMSVALPIKWIKTRGLKKGDNVFIKEEGNSLIINTDQGIELDKISIDVSDLDRTSVLLYIQSLYRFGYDEIQITFNKKTTTHYRLKKKTNISSIIHYTTNRLIGMEIIEQTENFVLIKNLIKETTGDFKNILRRIFLLLKETITSFVKAAQEHDLTTIKTVEEKHDNITKFVSYALRLLNKYGYPDIKKTYYYFHIIASLDKIADSIKYVARDILDYNHKLNDNTIEIFELTQNSLLLYYDLFYTFDKNKVDKLSHNRDFTKFKIKENIIKLPKHEIIFVMNLKQILEIILDLTDFRMGLEY